MRFKIIVLVGTILVPLLGGPHFALGQLLPSLPPPDGASALIAELGCASCHTDLPIKSTLRDRAPDLSHAGLRYQPAYLFEYLRNPVKVRWHLGRARMPDFHLSEKETLALIAFLETQRTIPGVWPELPAAIQSQLVGKSRSGSTAALETAKSEMLLCLTCHTLDGKGGTRAVELANVGHRLQPEWVKRFLVAPSMFGVAPTNMPAQFYRMSDDGRQFHESVSRPAERIHLLTDYLFSRSTEQRETLEKRFAAAKTAFSGMNAAKGEAIFRALNCAGCHRHHAILPPTKPAAPDLTQEARRVTPAWLQSYLQRPTAIRPFGYHPGDGSRMPDFRLSNAEVKELAVFFSAQPRTGPAPAREFEPQKLSAFARNKARTLLVEKLSCLGCHRLGGQGGRIGPDLAQVSLRLQPEYLYGIITDPRTANAHTIMPQIPLTADMARLIASFLLQQDTRSETTTYLSLAENPLIPMLDRRDGMSESLSARENYLRHCAACHGNEGRGDGFNARFLPRAPTVHADPGYMSTRPDDTLYDGIAAGGAILNRSHLMPQWGGSLSPKEIRELVAHIRTLCRCQGPAWSLDNRGR